MEECGKINNEREWEKGPRRRVNIMYLFSVFTISADVTLSK